MIAIIIIGITLDVIGIVLIAYTALRVHDRVLKEHSIGSLVVKEMGQEQTIGIIGVMKDERHRYRSL